MGCLSALASAGMRPSLSWMSSLVECSLPVLPGVCLCVCVHVCTHKCVVSSLSLVSVGVRPCLSWMSSLVEC